MPTPGQTTQKSDNRIQFKKKFSNKEQVEMIQVLQKDWLLSPQEVIERIICEGLCRERDKRREVANIKNSYRS